MKTMTRAIAGWGGGKRRDSVSNSTMVIPRCRIRAEWSVVDDKSEVPRPPLQCAARTTGRAGILSFLSSFVRSFVGYRREGIKGGK